MGLWEQTEGLEVLYTTGQVLGCILTDEAYCLRISPPVVTFISDRQ